MSRSSGLELPKVHVKDYIDPAFGEDWVRWRTHVDMQFQAMKESIEKVGETSEKAHSKLESLGQHIKQHIRSEEEKVEKIHVAIQEVKDDSKAYAHDTVEAFTSMKGGMKVLEWLGKGAAAITALAALGGIIWYMATHGGHLPPTKLE